MWLTAWKLSWLVVQGVHQSARAIFSAKKSSDLFLLPILQLGLRLIRCQMSLLSHQLHGGIGTRHRAMDVSAGDAVGLLTDKLATKLSHSHRYSRSETRIIRRSDNSRQANANT
jgi:hypothetical protein